MKSITRLSLALIMFSLFSISYLVTSVSAQQGTNPEISPTKGGKAPTAITGAPGMNPPGMPPMGNDDYVGAYGMDPRGNASRRDSEMATLATNPHINVFVDDVCDLVRTLTCKPDDIHGEDRSNGVDTVYAVCEGLKDACKQLRIVRGKIPR